jgi:hypothetical protein
MIITQEYLNYYSLMPFIYVSCLHKEAPMENNSKMKQVQEDLYFLYTTSFREVKREKHNQKDRYKYHLDNFSDREVRIEV